MSAAKNALRVICESDIPIGPVPRANIICANIIILSSHCTVVSDELEADKTKMTNSVAHRNV